MKGALLTSTFLMGLPLHSGFLKERKAINFFSLFELVSSFSLGLNIIKYRLMSAVRFKSINRDSRLEMVLDIVLTNLLKSFKHSLILTNTKNLTEPAFFPMKGEICKCASVLLCNAKMRSFYDLNSKMRSYYNLNSNLRICSYFNLLKIIINLLPESNLSFPLTIGHHLRKKGHLTNNIFSAAIEYLMSLYLFHLNYSSLDPLN